MAAYKPIDARRDEFRKYLERTGVLDMFTKVLSKLMAEDRPEDAIAFIRSNLGDSLNDKDTIASLNQKLEEANATIEQLRNKLRQYEPPTEVADSDAASVTDTVNTESTAELTTVAAPEPAKETVEPMQVETPKEAEVTPPTDSVPASETPSATPAAAAAEPEKTDPPAESEKTEEKTEEKPEAAPTPAAEPAEKQPDASSAPPPAAAPAAADPPKPAE